MSRIKKDPIWAPTVVVRGGLATNFLKQMGDKEGGQEDLFDLLILKLRSRDFPHEPLTQFQTLE